MEFRGMESRRLQAASRRLLAGKAEPTPAAVAPSPGVYKCYDVKTKATVPCQNPHTLVIIVAGMSCMMFLVSVALLLLCWSVVRQRRNERRRRESDSERSGSSTALAAAAPAVVANAQATPPVDSPEFDDAVFVQLPGDEKPQFFALPKPFQAAEDRSLPDDDKTRAEANLKSDEKESRLP